jgi:hypothetical protein
MAQQSSIIVFWNAMSVLLNNIASDPENNSLIQQVNVLVDTLGDFDWEYGPLDSSGYYFCLSPNGQENLVQAIDEIIALAPKLVGWKFIACKPRKPEIWSFIS